MATNPSSSRRTVTRLSDDVNYRAPTGALITSTSRRGITAPGLQSRVTREECNTPALQIITRRTSRAHHGRFDAALRWFVDCAREGNDPTTSV